MKKFALFFVLSALLWGCSSDEPSAGHKAGVVEENPENYRGAIDADLFEAYVSGGRSAVFDWSTMSRYRKNQQTQGEWALDTEVYFGGGNPFPSRMVLDHGEVWTDFELFDSSVGPHPLMLPLKAYEKLTGKPVNLYMRSKLAYDADTRSIVLNSQEYALESLAGDLLVLSTVSSYTSSAGDGDLMYVGEFLVSDEAVKFVDGRDFGFESEKELYVWAIALLRGTFGDEINLNEIFAPDVILDDPIVNLDYLEASLMYKAGEISEAEFADRVSEILK